MTNSSEVTFRRFLLTMEIIRKTESEKRFKRRKRDKAY